MTAATLLDRLDRPKRIGPNKWVARCPAHEDRTPSLAVRETDDGITIMHCFSGCDTEAVLAAVGLDFDALYPPTGAPDRKPVKRPWSAADLLRLLDRESLVVFLVTADAVDRGMATPADLDRLTQARGNIARIMEALA